MEQIKQAVERAKASATGEYVRPLTSPRGQIASPSHSVLANQTASAPTYRKVMLDGSHLEQNRIVAHNITDPRSKAFDMLRTQVLQTMDRKSWQLLAVTSPTEGCGKSVTAINLALSIARQPDRSTVLVDMDLPRPAVANYLGIKCREGLQGVLEGRISLADALILAQADSCKFAVLPTEAPTVRSSELIASRNMGTMLQDIKHGFRSEIVILDMPPLLQGDEVLATLPRIDAVLLVTAVGVSTLHEIKECARHLQGAGVIRIVLNKSNETAGRHYY